MNNMNNFNIYNNVSNNSPEQLAPIMPGTNVTDVNISGENNTPIDNNDFVNSVVEPVVPSFEEIQPIASTQVQPQVDVQPTMSVSEPTKVEPQVIPTLSIDDVLAKANQPSVVGTQPFMGNNINNFDNNNQIDNMNLENSFEMPNLSPINEEPTPIAFNSEFSVPNLNSINETPVGINNNQTIESIDIDTQSQIEPQVTTREQSNYEMPNLNPISENPEPVDDFLNSINSNQNQTPIGNSQLESKESLNNFSPFNFNRDDNLSNSPINTAPIIDTTVERPDKQSGFEMNAGIDAIQTPASIPTPDTQQFERVPEPIIVNDYNDQYDPIMPKTQNQKPTIDFKTIISLIRKCSQAIENSGYKIETEEYNLDNLYQVVFKIEKQ